MKSIYTSYHRVFDTDKIEGLRIEEAGTSDINNKNHFRIIGLTQNCFKCLLIFKTGSPDLIAYIPGILTRDLKFYKAPINCRYASINKIIISRSRYNTPGYYSQTQNQEEITIEVNCYSKDLSIGKHLQISILRKGYQVEETALSFAQRIINFLNECIEVKGNIDSIDTSLLAFDTFKVPDRYSLIQAIHALELEYYECSMNNPGKDNSFWDEVEIKNLPASPYLRRLFEEVLKNNFYRVYTTQHCITICSESEKAWSPSFPRRKLEPPTQDLLYKPTLLFEISRKYSSFEMVFEKLQTQKIDKTD